MDSNPVRAVPFGDIYRAFAGLLQYPEDSLRENARTCARLLANDFPQAVRDMEEFAALIAGVRPGRMEEVYTGTFDLNPSCCPYVGYHLLGESYKRAELLVGLQERYRGYGFETGHELADHLAVVLSFLGHVDPGADVAAELVADALLPAVGKMLGTFNGSRSSENPYRKVLGALQRVLEAHAGNARRSEEARQ